MTRIAVSLTSSSQMSHVPLAALGYALRRAEVLQPLAEMELAIKTMPHTPADKLMEGLVLILAGGRATSQANLLLRPKRDLACAWGQTQCAEQSTLSDTFDALSETEVEALRTACAAITQAWSLSCRHDFRRGGWTLDGDLTGRPASRRAAGSQKGYFAGKKIATDGKSPGSPWTRMANASARCCFPARNKARIACNRWC
ncbi:MAG: hypothetical protein L0099_16105 [Acidobacteria bacterium]|nr:hypothetical protein [Acidobacteriota bacterium]